MRCSRGRGRAEAVRGTRPTESCAASGSRCRRVRRELDVCPVAGLATAAIHLHGPRAVRPGDHAEAAACCRGGAGRQAHRGMRVNNLRMLLCSSYDLPARSLWQDIYAICCAHCQQLTFKACNVLAVAKPCDMGSANVPLVGKMKQQTALTATASHTQAHEHAVTALMSLLGAVTAQPETVSVTEPLPFSNDLRPILPNQGTADAEDAARTADGATGGSTAALAVKGKAAARGQTGLGACCS